MQIFYYHFYIPSFFSIVLCNTCQVMWCDMLDTRGGHICIWSLNSSKYWPQYRCTANKNFEVTFWLWVFCKIFYTNSSRNLIRLNIKFLLIFKNVALINLFFGIFSVLVIIRNQRDSYILLQPTIPVIKSGSLRSLK